MQLGGKRILLTGATGGLGRAIAQALAGRGVSLVLSSRKEDELAKLAGELPGSHSVAVSDLAEDGAALALVAEAGELDGLVANAGLPGSGRIDDFSQEEIGRALRVNLESPIRMARELVPRLQERGGGHLVFISSLAAKAASPRTSLYSATKFGLRGFAFALKADLTGTPVGVSVVSPGFIREAGMFAEAGAKPPAGLGTATPEQVGAAVVRAIEGDKLEVAVAPLRQRALAHFGLASPRTALRILTGGAANKAADDLASGQADKR
jgi:short-subunit dehydrogenase